jgi:RNA polymerase sigma-70 factor (ECF subfamily)
MPAGLRDPRRFARAFAEHAHEIHAAAVAVLRDPVRADDVVQDVYLRLWRRPEAWDPARGPLGPYLRLMARSRALDLWREAEVRERALRRAGEAMAPEPRAEAADGPDAATLRAADRAELVAALRTLPEEQRRAIALAYWGGLTAEEIAVRTGIPLGTAKSRVRLALRRLRAEPLELLAA